MPLDYPIHEKTLANGLRVVVSPDASVPDRDRQHLGQRRVAPRAGRAHRLRPPLRAPDVPGVAAHRQR